VVLMRRAGKPDGSTALRENPDSAGINRRGSHS